MNIPNVNSAALAQIIFEGRLEEALSTFDLGDASRFLEKALSDEAFGVSGKYSYFCKHCGGQWSFETKMEKQMFEKIHKITGCTFVFAKNENSTHKSSNWKKTRSNKNIHPNKKELLDNVILSLQEKQLQRTSLILN